MLWYVVGWNQGQLINAIASFLGALLFHDKVPACHVFESILPDSTWFYLIPPPFSVQFLALKWPGEVGFHPKCRIPRIQALWVWKCGGCNLVLVTPAKLDKLGMLPYCITHISHYDTLIHNCIMNDTAYPRCSKMAWVRPQRPKLGRLQNPRQAGKCEANSECLEKEGTGWNTKSCVGFYVQNHHVHKLHKYEGRCLQKVLRPLVNKSIKFAGQIVRDSETDPLHQVSYEANNDNAHSICWRCVEWP